MAARPILAAVIPLHGKETRTKPTADGANNADEAAQIAPGSLVYGYLQAEEPDEIQIGLWRKEIGLFCREQGYRLALVFVDRGISDDQAARTGFTGLLDVLALDAYHGVVVPHRDHLSSDGDVFALLTRLIRRTASTLLVVHGDDDADGTTTAEGA